MTFPYSACSATDEDWRSLLRLKMGKAFWMCKRATDAPATRQLLLRPKKIKFCCSLYLNYFLAFQELTIWVMFIEELVLAWSFVFLHVLYELLKMTSNIQKVMLAFSLQHSWNQPPLFVFWFFFFKKPIQMCLGSLHSFLRENSLEGWANQ